MRLVNTLVGACVVVALVACGGDKATGPAPVVAISITPASLTLKVGESQTLAASLTDAKGAALTGRTVTWSVADASVAQVTSSGAVTAIAPGLTTITATAEGRSAATAVNVLNPPRITISTSAPKAFVDDTVIVSWSATNATSCTASGAWTGTLGVSGTQRIVPTEGGVKAFDIRCDGAGGTNEASIRLVVPMPVFGTSYENNVRIRIDDPTIPSASEMGIPNPDWLHGGSGAIADFFQEGSYSAVVTKTGAQVGKITSAYMPGTLYFVRRDASGKWRDNTRSILTDQTSCISPRKALVADYNNDRRPDVLFACAGPDEDLTISRRPAGENSRLLLSQQDGTYRNIVLPYRGYAHTGTAADLNGDGNIDVILGNNTDTEHALGIPTATEVEPYVLLGDGKGGFTLDMTRLLRTPPLRHRYITDLELVDITGSGRLDLFYTGAQGDATGAASYIAGCCHVGSGFIQNDGNGRFLGAPKIFPNLKSPAGLLYDTGMDVVVAGGAVFVLQVRVMYDGMIVSRYDPQTLAGRVVFERTTPFSDGWTYLTWLYPREDGMMLARTIDCPTIGFQTSRCGVAFPWK